MAYPYGFPLHQLSLTRESFFPISVTEVGSNYMFPFPAPKLLFSFSSQSNNEQNFSFLSLKPH